MSPTLAKTKKTDKAEAMRAIHDELLMLTDSPLYTYRTENSFLPVVGDGNPDAHIMFVGEAPGRNEAKTGKPFCGAAGKILDELLASVGVDRASVYVTNIVKDRPPENRDPTPEEIVIYGPYLDRQIDIIEPEVIVTLGRYAMIYIMKKFGLETEIETIGQAHGKVYHAHTAQTKGARKLDIVTLYHPCAAIYDRAKLPMLKTDFQILKKYEKTK